MGRDLRWIGCVIAIAVASVVGPLVPAGAATLSYDDPTGDTFVAGGNESSPAVDPRADIVSVGVTYDWDKIAFMMRVASPSDPRADPDWSEPFTKATWFIDINYEPKYAVIYRMLAGALTARVYTSSSLYETPICDAVQVTYDGGTYAAAIDPGCIGSPQAIEIIAAMYIDRGSTASPRGVQDCAICGRPSAPVARGSDPTATTTTTLPPVQSTATTISISTSTTSSSTTSTTSRPSSTTRTVPPRKTSSPTTAATVQAEVATRGANPAAAASSDSTTTATAPFADATQPTGMASQPASAPSGHSRTRKSYGLALMLAAIIGAVISLVAASVWRSSRRASLRR